MKALHVLVSEDIFRRLRVPSTLTRSKRVRARPVCRVLLSAVKVGEAVWITTVGRTEAKMGRIESGEVISPVW